MDTQDFGHEHREQAAQEDQVQRPFFTADHITDALSQTLDQLQQKGQFTLGDVLGGLKVLELQVQEQILVQYRFNMGSRLRAQAAAQGHGQRHAQPGEEGQTTSGIELG